MADQLALMDFFDFLLWSTVGNDIGGTVFVGLLEYGHGIRPGTTKDDIDVSVEGEKKEQRM